MQPSKSALPHKTRTEQSFQHELCRQQMSTVNPCKPIFSIRSNPSSSYGPTVQSMVGIWRDSRADVTGAAWAMGTCDGAAGGRAWVVVTLLWMCLDFTLLYLMYPDVSGLIWHDLARFGMTLCEQYRDISWYSCFLRLQSTAAGSLDKRSNARMQSCFAAGKLLDLTLLCPISWDWLRLVTGWQLKRANTGQRSCGDGWPHSS